MNLQGYTGRRGLYVKVAATNLRLPRALSRLVREDLHVTLMWSTAAPEPATLRTLWPTFLKPMRATLERLAWIPGHDARGYLVGELDSEDAQNGHHLLTKVGCDEHSSFYPHVTLLFDITEERARPLIAQFNPVIARRPVSFLMVNATCTDWR